MKGLKSNISKEIGIRVAVSDSAKSDVDEMGRKDRIRSKGERVMRLMSEVCQEGDMGSGISLLREVIRRMDEKGVAKESVLNKP